MRQFWFIALFFVLSACGNVATQNSTEVDSDLLDRGIEVYRINYCGACHTLTVAGTRGTFGPNHDNERVHAQANIQLDSYTGDANTVSEYIRESLLTPALFYTPGFEATNHHMPPFSHLTEADINALIYLLENQ